MYRVTNVSGQRIEVCAICLDGTIVTDWFEIDEIVYGVSSLAANQLKSYEELGVLKVEPCEQLSRETHWLLEGF